MPRGALEALERVLELTRVDQQIAEVQIRAGTRRVDQQRVLQRFERGLGTAKLAQRGAEVVPTVREPRIDLDGLLEAACGVLEIAEQRERAAEVRPRARIVGRELARALCRADRGTAHTRSSEKHAEVPVHTGVARCARRLALA